MNLTKALFRASKKMGKKAVKSAVKDVKSMTKGSKTTGKKERESYYEDPYDLFERKYGSTCERKEAAIDDVETDHSDPDKNVAAYEKKLAMAHELEDYCKSHGSGGVEYFNECFSGIYERIQADLDDYMANEYENDMMEFKEEQAEKKEKKSIASKIIKSIQKCGGSMPQTELKKLLSDDELFYYNSVIKELTESGKIKRLNPSGRVVFQVVK